MNSPALSPAYIAGHRRKSSPPTPTPVDTPHSRGSDEEPSKTTLCLLFLDLIVEPLIRWLTAADKVCEIASGGLKLVSKWHADHSTLVTLVTNLIENMISLMDIAQEFSSWSGIRLNIAKCKITAYIRALQNTPHRRGVL